MNYYTCIHVKRPKIEVKAKTTYQAAKKAAMQWRLKGTAGIDVYLHVEEGISPSMLPGS